MKVMWKRIGRDTAIFASAALVMAVFQFGYRYVAMRELPVNDYGRIALTLALFNAVLVAAHFGIPVAAARLAPSLTEGDARLLLNRASRAAILPAFGGTLLVAVLAVLTTGSSQAAFIIGVGMGPMVVGVVLAGWLRGRDRVFASASVQPVNTLVQLVALLVFLLMGHVTVATTLWSFTIGNAAAALLSLALVAGELVGVPSRAIADIGDELQTWSILRFSFWVTVSGTTLYAAAAVPRLALSISSFADVAVFDLALLAYSVPTRIIASLITALVPVAARAYRSGEAVVVPSVGSALTLLGLTALVALLLLQSDVIGAALNLMGLPAYRSAEAIILVLMLAIPADLLAGISIGVFQARGEARSLAGITALALAAAVSSMPLVARIGMEALAFDVVLVSWFFYALARRRLLMSHAIVEKPIIRGIPRAWRSR